jgi:hypothetical protein
LIRIRESIAFSKARDFATDFWRTLYTLLDVCFTGVLCAMKTNQNDTKRSRLTDQIEIIRDNPEQTRERGGPPLDDEANPLHALKELAEKLEALEELPLAGSLGRATAGGSDTSDKATRHGYMNEVDQYLELFQKQSTVLRRLLQKLN